MISRRLISQCGNLQVVDRPAPGTGIVRRSPRIAATQLNLITGMRQAVYNFVPAGSPGALVVAGAGQIDFLRLIACRAQCRSVPEPIGIGLLYRAVVGKSGQ